MIQTILLIIVLLALMVHIINKRKKKRNLIYFCAFMKEDYVLLVDLLLSSIKKYGKRDSLTDILIITDKKLLDKISELESYRQSERVYFSIYDIDQVVDATFARYNIYDWENIMNYDRILYLDTDILVLNNLKNIFSIDTDKICAIEEGHFGNKYHGEKIFSKDVKKKEIPSFSSGMMYFKNTDLNKKIFDETYALRKKDFDFFDQPYFNYVAYKYKNYNVDLLNGKAINNPFTHNGETVCHFPGGVGNNESKISKMTKFWKYMENKYEKNKV